MTDSKTRLGKVVEKIKIYSESDIDDDLILIWSSEKTVITGADTLGSLLHGIAMLDIKTARE